MSDFQFLNETNPIEIVKYIKQKDVYEETDTNYYIKQKKEQIIGGNFGNFVHIPFKDIAPQEAIFKYCPRRSRYILTFIAEAAEYHMFLKIHNKVILIKDNEWLQMGTHYLNFNEDFHCLNIFDQLFNQISCIKVDKQNKWQTVGRAFTMTD